MKAIRLRTEYLKNPIGIDLEAPRFSWNCEGGIQQEAYEVNVTDDKGNFVWNSGIVYSDKMHLIELESYTPKSRDILKWRVRLMENGIFGAWSDEASFEMGLLQAEDWKASWITGDYKAEKKIKYPVDYFLKEVRLDRNKVINKARIYATACGIYEISLNGEKAGNFCLAPGYTDYNKRIQYQTIDVTELVRKAGDQLAIQAELASGWYRGSIGAHGLRCEYGKETKLLLQLEITYEDGSRLVVCSDDSWKWSNDGPIRYADNKDGEYVDENKQPSFSGKAKRTVFSVIPTASNNVPLTEHEHFQGKISKSPSGKTIVNFGQNLAGRISMQFTAHQGQLVRLRFGELLGNDGELSQKNIQCISKKKITPLQEVLYVCKEGLNTYTNRFSIFGFQYVEIESAELHMDERDYYKNYFEEVKSVYNQASIPVDFNDFSIEAIAVYSDIE